MECSIARRVFRESDKSDQSDLSDTATKSILFSAASLPSLYPSVIQPRARLFDQGDPSQPGAFANPRFRPSQGLPAPAESQPQLPGDKQAQSPQHSPSALSKQ